MSPELQGMRVCVLHEQRGRSCSRVTGSSGESSGLFHCHASLVRQARPQSTSHWRQIRKQGLAADLWRARLVEDLHRLRACGRALRVKIGRPMPGHQAGRAEINAGVRPVASMRDIAQEFLLRRRLRGGRHAQLESRMRAAAAGVDAAAGGVCADGSVCL